jgi:HSP20 family protein
MILKRLHNLPNWTDPFDDVKQWRQLMSDFGRKYYDEPHAGVFPLLNVSATKDHYIVRAELPGIKAQELDITVTGDNLTISGERKILSESNGTRYHRREREAGKFNRVISLQGPLDADRVTAALKNGILKVVIPKAEEAKPKKISIL